MLAARGRLLPLVAIAAALVLACGAAEDRAPALKLGLDAAADRPGAAVGTGVAAMDLPPPPETGGPAWWIEAGERRIEGWIAYVGRGEGRLALQLVGHEGENLLLVVADDGGAAERDVETAVLSFGRAAPCLPVASDPPFRARLAAGDDGWLEGSFAGLVACDRASGLGVRGTFRLRNAEVAG